MPEGSRCRTAVPGISHLCPRAPGFYQWSKATRARVQRPAINQQTRATRDRALCPAGSTSSPRRLALWSKTVRG